MQLLRMQLPISFENSRWTPKKFIVQSFISILFACVLLAPGMAVLAIYNVGVTLSTLLLVPLIVPFILYFILAPNANFDVNRYRSTRGNIGIIIDILLILAASSFCIPVGIVMKMLSVPVDVVILVSLLVAVPCGYGAYLRRNRRFFDEDSNPWFSAPLLPK